MQARRREEERYERHESEVHPTEHEEYEATQYHTEQYQPGPSPIGLRGSVDWASVWTGLISAVASFFILGALVIAVGWAASGGTTSVVWAIVVSFIAFFVGGWLAGTTSYRNTGRTEGFVLGSMVWALGAAFLLILGALAIGGGLGAVLGGAAATGSNLQPIAIGTLIVLVVTYVAAVAGAVLGAGTQRSARVQ